MKYEIFLKNFLRKTREERRWFYLISSFVFGMGLFFGYSCLFTDWYEIREMTPDKLPKWVVYALSGFLLLLGVYGFWKIPRIYAFHRIPLANSISAKNKIIDQLISELKLTELERTENYLHCLYRGTLWSKFDVYIYWDPNSIYLNVQEQAIQQGGFIDFGTSRKVFEKLKSKIASGLV